MGSLIELLSSRFGADEVRAPLAADAAGLRAAVAAIVRPGPAGEEMLFIKRADRDGDPWSGHMAFPGGRRQATDATLLETAVRETLEEVGLDLHTCARPIARLPDVAPYSRMPAPLTVTAFVFSLQVPANLTLNHEVAAAVWSPLDPILRGEGATTFRYLREGVPFDLPAFDVEGGVVWGLTYRMIELLRELTPR
ncbi:MAG TPA: CoA pyrophosphatase [Polyangiaceae bacterium]|jgi:8-oxo-dGTP pyrophosphatase MutT (NUDIX family)